MNDYLCTIKSFDFESQIVSVVSEFWTPVIYRMCDQTSEPVVFTFIYLFMVEHYDCCYGCVPPCFSEKQM